MRISRRVLVDHHRSQYFHVVSRVVDRRFIFQNEEKSVFLRMMRKLESFCGIEVLSYCLMSNHFHLLIHVPRRPDKIDDTEVLRRMKELYSNKKMEEFHEYMNELEQAGLKELKSQFLDRFRNRMYDLSQFVRELKLKFSKYYNAKIERKGTLWEERFKSCLIEGHTNALMNTAAYMELNPVRAGLVEDPADYQWCSFAEAKKGGKTARMGIIKLASGFAHPMPYKEAEKSYRAFFVAKSVSQSGSLTGMNAEELHAIQQNSVAQDRKSSKSFSIKVRSFTEGLILGSREFIEETFNRNKDSMSPQRKKISTRIPDTHEDLYSYRDLNKVQ